MSPRHWSSLLSVFLSKVGYECGSHRFDLSMEDAVGISIAKVLRPSDPDLFCEEGCLLSIELWFEGLIESCSKSGSGFFRGLSGNPESFWIVFEGSEMDLEAKKVEL